DKIEKELWLEIKQKNKLGKRLKLLIEKLESLKLPTVEWNSESSENTNYCSSSATNLVLIAPEEQSFVSETMICNSKPEMEVENNRLKIVDSDNQKHWTGENSSSAGSSYSCNSNKDLCLIENGKDDNNLSQESTTYEFRRDLDSSRKKGKAIAMPFIPASYPPDLRRSSRTRSCLAVFFKSVFLLKLALTLCVITGNTSHKCRHLKANAPAPKPKLEGFCLASDLPKIVQAGYNLISYFLFSPQEGLSDDILVKGLEDEGAFNFLSEDVMSDSMAI
ncbi:hypothetical protein GIB67_001137, partial [Kingdonia uniflora]